MNRPLITLLLALVIIGGARATPVLAAGTDPAGARDRTPIDHTVIGTSDMRLAQGSGRGRRDRRGDGAEGRRRSGDAKAHRDFHRRTNDAHREWHRAHGGRDRGGANKGGDGPGQGVEERRRRRDFRDDRRERRGESRNDRRRRPKKFRDERRERRGEGRRGRP